MGNQIAKVIEQPLEATNYPAKINRSSKNNASLNSAEIDQPSFPHAGVLKKKDKVIIASKNIWTESDEQHVQRMKHDASKQNIAPSSNEEKLGEIKQWLRPESLEQIMKSDRVKIKRPAFKKITIDPFQFITKKKNPIREDYELIKVIGSGSYGQVYRSFYKKTKQIRAVKEIEKSKLSEEQLKMLMNQCEILGRMDHPHIIKLYEIYESINYMYVVTEYCEGGSLLSIMNNYKLKQADIRIIMTQILSAVTYMHSQNIIHKDIKPDNLVLVQKITSMETIKDIQLKFIDFGISMDLSKENQVDSENIFGTLMYMPPQSMLGTVHLSWDIWSCGIICYVLATHKIPYFKNLSNDELCDIIRRAKINRTNMQNLSSEFKVFIMSLLEKSYLFRSTAAKALKDVWMTKGKKKNLKNIHKKNAIARLNNYEAHNNLISVIESYLVCKKINQSERQHLASIFQQIDEDKSGIIDVEEFKQFYQQNSQFYDAQEVQKLILSIDKNNSGKIDFNQFITAMCSRRKLFSLESLGQAFDFFDKDSSGQLQKGQIKLLLSGVESEELEYMFKALDSDHDEKISRKEFMNYFENFMQEK